MFGQRPDDPCHHELLSRPYYDTSVAEQVGETPCPDQHKVYGVHLLSKQICQIGTAFSMLVWIVFGTSLILMVVYQTQPILIQDQFGCLPFDIVPSFLAGQY